MNNCQKVSINYDLYFYLSNLANACKLDLELLEKGSVGETFKLKVTGIPNLRDYYVVKTLAVNSQSNREKEILQLISQDMIKGNAPLLFPFLYTSYVCGNTLHLVMQPAEVSLSKVITGKSIEWWATTLYQLSKAIYYLEEKQINHNDLTFDNIMFQNFSDDYLELALMLIDFGTASQGYYHHARYPPFIIGRDLNYFLYILIFRGAVQGYFPIKLAEELRPFLRWENIPPLYNENKFDYGLRRTNIAQPNWNTSGKHISRWLAKFYPFVTDRCSMSRLNKLYGVGIGSIIGDTLNDTDIKYTLNLMDTILSNNRTISREFRHPKHVWPIVILYHYNDCSAVIENINVDSEYETIVSVFFSCLIHKLINNIDLDTAISECLEIIQKYSKTLYEAIKSTQTSDNIEIDDNDINSTISAIMWVIQNTDTFEDALIRVERLLGNTLNRSIVGAIAGAIYGFENIPSELLKKIKDIELIKDKIATLAQC